MLKLFSVFCFVFFSVLLNRFDSFAEEIIFSTKDGKFSTSGVVADYFLLGKRIPKPENLRRGVSITIQKSDGVVSPQVPLDILSDETLAAIDVNFLIRSPLREVEKAVLQQHRDGINKMLEGGGRDEIKRLRRELGSDARSDAVFDFVLSYLEFEAGESRSGKLIAIASKYDGHFEAWKAAVFSTLGEKGADRAVNVLEKARSEIVKYGTLLLQHKDEDFVEQELDRIAEFSAWLLSTSQLFENSEATKSVVPGKIINDAELSQVLAQLKTFKERRREREVTDFEIANNLLQEEEERKKALARDAYAKIVEWENRAVKIWENGLAAFFTQQKIFQSASTEMQIAHNQWQQAYSRKTQAESEVRSAESLVQSAERMLEDAELDELGDAQAELSRATTALTTATTKFATWEAQEQIAYTQYSARQSVAYAELSRLRGIYQQLALFVNESKNLAILFENHYLDAFEYDEELKKKWLGFTDRLKLTISQFPAMPSIQLPRVSGRRKQAELEKELLKKIDFDITNFWDQIIQMRL